MKFPTSYTLKTPRCLLRFVSKEDIPRIFSASRVEGFNDGMLWDAPEKEEDLLEPFESNLKAWMEDRGYAFSIDEKGSNEFVGRISIRPKAKNVWDIGFWTHPVKQNKGFMSETVKSILWFGFEELKATQIVACHAIWNKASESVLKKNGMEFLEHIPKGFQKRGEWVAENLLGVMRERWESNKASETTETSSASQ
jgi:ribosomal-protein-alanine N-acetyltransferase